MTALIVVGVIFVLVVIMIFTLVGPSTCTGDALSGLDPCINYPDCDCY